MKITRYDQACLLVETRGKRILIDSGSIGLTNDTIDKDWTNIDAILITHRHNDHCDDNAINTIALRDIAVVYTTKEVSRSHNLKNVKTIKEGDIFSIDNIKVEVTHAMHGFLMPMKYSGMEVKENVGYIIDDGNTRLYTTSDTIGFNNDYKCDILCMPFNGNGLTMGIIDGTLFAKDIDPKLLLPIHMQHPNPEMNPNMDTLKHSLDNANINYKMLKVGESIEFTK